MIRSLLYSIKRRLQGRPALYRALYDLATFNPDYLQQRRERRHYSSAFGGLWTDRDDFPQLMAARQARGEIDDATAAQLRAWRDNGFIKLPGAVSHELIDAYVAELAELKNHRPSPLLITSHSLQSPTPYTPDLVRDNDSVRTVDDYFFSSASRQLLFQPAVTDFLTLAFGRSPVLTQSLNFECGSEQDVHQDTAFVTMNSPLRFAGVWIALEDVQPGSGELVYYPGSHHWPDFLFSGHFKHYDRERDGLEQLQDWYRWIHEEAVRQGSRLQRFLPKKGEVLIWHGGLAHGGGTVSDRSLTRHSLVGHFCAQGVRPLYHYYKPGQRKRHYWQGNAYYSSYYRA